MKMKLGGTLLLLLMLFFMTTGSIQAQSRATPTPIPSSPTAVPPVPPASSPIPALNQAMGQGAIRGTVFADENGDGDCSAADTPVMADVPIEFSSDGVQDSIMLSSGEDGTFGLAAAGLGRWTVTAKAPAGYVVTSEDTVSLNLSDVEPMALNVNFCVSKASAVKILLPESGAANSGSTLFILFLAGALLVMISLAAYKRVER